jgi:hypothetical protein
VHWWLTLVVLGTQEDEIRRPEPWANGLETLSRKNPSQKMAGGVAQGVGPEYHKKKILELPTESSL